MGSQQPTDGFGGGYSSFESRDDSNGARQKSGSFIATCGFFFQPCWKFTKVLFELINRVRA